MSEQDERGMDERLSDFAIESGLADLEQAIGIIDQRMARIIEAARQLGWDLPDPMSAVSTVLFLHATDAGVPPGLLEPFAAGGGLTRLTIAWMSGRRLLE